MTSDKKNMKGTLPISDDALTSEKNVHDKNSQEGGAIKEKLQGTSTNHNSSSNQDSSGSEKKPSNKNLSFRLFLLVLFISLISIFFIFNDDVTNKFILFKNYLNEQYFKKNNDVVSDQIITEGDNSQDSFSEFNPEPKELSESALSEITEPMYEESSEEVAEEIPQLVPTEPEKAFDSQQEKLGKQPENDQISSNLIESEINSDTISSIKLKEKIKKQRYIIILEEMALNVKKLSFNSKRIEVEDNNYETNDNSELSEKLISKLLSLIKVTKIHDEETGLLTDDFYLIIREHLKLRLLSAKVIIASNLDVSPSADLTEASFLLEKYFLRDSVFDEIKENLEYLIKLTNTNEVINNYQGK